MRKCVICDARVRNINPKTKTCDPTCTRARKHGRTRQEQFRAEMIEEAEKFNQELASK